ncbi:MAG: glycosyltransferase [Spirochaetota bacterium]|nr:MAG: glycosyltransferase [Spirochaetota bacterium]
MTERLRASIIIPTHNRCDVLSKVLSSYKTQTISNDNFEHIIVDDGSSDDTQFIFNNLQPFKINKENIAVKQYENRIEGIRSGELEIKPEENGGPIQIKYIKLKKSGRSVARNIGIGLASYPLIIFADDDIFVEPMFIEKHIKEHDFDDMFVIRGTVIHTRSLEHPFSARWKPKDINTSFLATGNASVLKKHLMSAGLFDEHYQIYGWEDFDLGIHLKQNGLSSIKKKIYGYHYDPHIRQLKPDLVYKKEKERGFTAVYFYTSHPLGWVKRFTRVKNGLLDAVFRCLGRKNWFLKRDHISALRGIVRLIIRYKGYFDGVRDGKMQYMHEDNVENR